MVTTGINHITDTEGRKTALVIDLQHPQTDTIFREPFNKSQIELLKMFTNPAIDKHVNELHGVLVNFLYQKLQSDLNVVWNEQNFNAQDIENWLNDSKS